MRAYSLGFISMAQRVTTLCAALACLAVSAEAANYFRFNDVLTSRYVCTTSEGERFCDVRFNKHLNAVSHLAWTTNDVDISTFDETTTFSIDNGEFGGVSFTLGEAGFRPGRRMVIFRFHDDETERVNGRLVVTWNKKGITIVASSRGTIAAESLIENAEPGPVNLPMTSIISMGDFQRTLTGSVRGSFTSRTITRNEEEFSLPRIFLNGNLRLAPPEL